MPPEYQLNVTNKLAILPIWVIDRIKEEMRLSPGTWETITKAVEAAKVPEKTACAVRLPPATTFAAGVSVASVLMAIKQRAGFKPEFLEFTQPAPQHHDEPIAWMVGTAFWWTKEEAVRDAAATGLPIVGLGPMTGAEPAEQRQVDQVVNAEQVLGAYQFASFGPANHLHGTTNWCAAFAQELNHRIGADTAEVERISKELREVREERDDLCRRVGDFQSRTHGIKNLSAIEQLTDKLAERDALLTKMKALFRTDDPFDLYDAVCAILSASTEPSVTTPQKINGHKLNCKAVDDYKPGQCSCSVEIDHEIPGTSFQRLNALANQGE